MRSVTGPALHRTFISTIRVVRTDLWHYPRPVCMWQWGGSQAGVRQRVATRLSLHSFFSFLSLPIHAVSLLGVEVYVLVMSMDIYLFGIVCVFFVISSVCGILASSRRCLWYFGGKHRDMGQSIDGHVIGFFCTGWCDPCS